MVDRDVKTNQSDKTAIEQRATTFQMSHRDSVIAFGDMEFVLDHAAESAGVRTAQRREPLG